MKEHLKDFEKDSWVKQDIKEKRLEWGKSSDKEMTWKEAKEWCEKQGGRLPTIVELLEAYQGKVEGFEKDFYWSSSEGYSTCAWSLYFTGGVIYGYNKSNPLYVRVCRGG